MAGNRQVITYKQLLKLVTDAGIQSIKTSIVQLPTAENGNTAVFRATLTMQDGREFDGTADAAPNNVSPAMLICLPRMAETRAKARCMRDAANIGEVAAEELADFGDSDYAPRERRDGAANAPAPKPKPKPAPDGPILDTQIQAITKMCGAAGIDAPNMEGWSNAKACEYITSAQTRRN